MSHRWLLPCTLSITCLCGCGGRPADQPSAAPPPFDVVGVWRSLDGQGQVFHITVNADHTASSDWGEGETGRWAVEGSRVHVWYDDGWHDFLEQTPDGFRKVSFAPGTSLDGPPENVHPATRLTAAEAEQSIRDTAAAKQRLKNME